MMRMVWYENRRRATLSLSLVTLATLSLAASAQQVVTDHVPAAAGWSMSEILTPQNVLSLLVLVFHFGVLRQEMRGMQEQITKLQSWQETARLDFARKDVLDAKRDAIHSAVEALTDKADSIEGRINGIRRQRSE